MKKEFKAFATRAVHAGEHLPPADFIPVVGPIHPTVGFAYDRMEDLDGVLGTTREGYVYPRYGSPTVAAFEAATADLERGEAAYAFSSGMAAIHVALLTAGVRQGSKIVAATDIYGATFTMLRRLFAEFGIESRLVDVTDLDAVERALDEVRPLILVAETISNPLLKIADQPALINLSHRYGAQVLTADSLGMVAPGKVADLVILNRNPAEDITATRDIAWVMLRGRQIRPDSVRTSWTK